MFGGSNICFKTFFVVLVIATSIPVVGDVNSNCSSWAERESQRNLSSCSADLTFMYPCPTGDGNTTDATWAKNEVTSGPHGWYFDLCCNKEGGADSESARKTGYCEPRDCQFNQGSVDFCIRSPSVSCDDDVTEAKHYVTNQCCYNSEGSLLRTKNEGAGSMSLQPGRIGNIFPHYEMDLKPYNDCCIATVDNFDIHEQNCEIYEKYRPTILGTYSASVTVTAQFDPHFSTSDGLMYSFMDVGVFTYLVTDLQEPFQLQISTRKMGSGAMISGFALKYKTANVELFRVDSATTVFYINDADLSNELMTPFSRSGIRVELLEGGMKLNVEELQLILNVMKVPDKSFIGMYTTLPAAFFGHARGLVGFYDGDANNDYTTKDKYRTTESLRR